MKEISFIKKSIRKREKNLWCYGSVKRREVKRSKNKNGNDRKFRDNLKEKCSMSTCDLRLVFNQRESKIFLRSMAMMGDKSVKIHLDHAVNFRSS